MLALWIMAHFLVVSNERTVIGRIAIDNNKGEEVEFAQWKVAAQADKAGINPPPARRPRQMRESPSAFNWIVRPGESKQCDPLGCLPGQAAHACDPSPAYAGQCQWNSVHDAKRFCASH